MIGENHVRAIREAFDKLRERTYRHYRTALEGLASAGVDGAADSLAGWTPSSPNGLGMGLIVKFLAFDGWTEEERVAFVKVFDDVNNGSLTKTLTSMPAKVQAALAEDIGREMAAAMDSGGDPVDAMVSIISIVGTHDHSYGTNFAGDLIEAAVALAGVAMAVGGTSEVEAIELTRLEQALEQTRSSLATSPTEIQRERRVPLKSHDNDTMGDDEAKAALSELDELIGLDDVKFRIRTLANLARVNRIRQEMGLPVAPQTHHVAFVGNPGTGKTTVARLYGRVLTGFGVLASGRLVEVSRATLVAGFVGQTAIRTRQAVEDAQGGVLFVDEAYALAGEGQDYGREAIHTLVKEMEDRRDQFALILAGYTEPMRELIRSNPGFVSRLRGTIAFPDFSRDELVLIFQRFVSSSGYVMIPEAEAKLRSLLPDKLNGNGRDIRKLFEVSIERQANRLATDHDLTRSELTLLLPEDLPEQVDAD